MEETLAKLVAMPTISDDTVANELALDYIEQYLSERGMHTERFVFTGHGALTATIKPGIKKTRVILYAHVDVMPGTEQVFTMRREGEKLFGRGVLDMKYAIAGYMHFIDRIQGRLNDYDFSIMITTDEEYGSRNNINSIPHILELGYAADVCIMPDGGRPWDVEAMTKGYWRFDLVASGKSAHGSRPWEGDSASFKLIQALHELRRAFRNHGPDTDTLNIGQIHGDGTYNQLPAQMSAGLEIRLSTDKSYAKNEALLQKLCAKYGLTVKTQAHRNPLKQDINHPLLQGFMESITRITGHQSKPCLSHGSSDALYFNTSGIPCAITYIPGGGHHGEDEWISREALPLFPLVIEDYIEHNARKNTR
jgi:succinyl-diaminopimelate desuccinylase